MSSSSLNGLKPERTSPFGTTRMRGISDRLLNDQFRCFCHYGGDVRLSRDTFKLHLGRTILPADLLLSTPPESPAFADK